MKTTSPSPVNPGWSRWFAAAGTLALLASPAWAADAPAAEAAEKEKADAPAESEKPKDYRNWVEVSLGATFVDGDGAQFQARRGVPEGVFGGVTDFHYEQNVGKKAQFTADGRGIFDNHDYAIRLELSEEEKGFVRFGYTQARTWYDGTGGYFPGAGATPYFSPVEDELAVDRSELWFEAGLRLPKWPEFTIRYSHQTRDGDKDSTAWGDSNQTGGVGARSYVPAWLQLDETRDTLAADGKHRVGKTSFGVGLRYETASQDNRQKERRYPGEARDAYVTQQNASDTDLFNLHAFSDTRLSAKVRFTVGYAFTDLTTDTTGYRVYGTAYDPDMAQRLRTPETFEGLAGTSELSQHVVNLNLMVLPWKNLTLVPSVRVEKQDSDGASSYGQPAQPFSPNPYSASSDRGLLDVSERLELRYTGLTNWAFYAAGDWLQGSGDLNESWRNEGNAVTFLRRSTDDERVAQKYSVGARWYPLKRLHLSAEYYHKQRDNDYDHPTDTTANDASSFSRYPAFLRALSYDTDDANLRITWRPRNNLTLVGRYDYQRSTMRSRGDQLAEVESSELTSHILSGSASWIPWPRLYFQSSLNYVQDQTDTPVSDLTAAVQDAENDYWTATLGAGFVLDDKTDLEAQYVYYRADNYLSNAPDGMPYGAGDEEQGVTAGLVHRFSPRVRFKLKYGFFTNRDDTSGGQTDYDAHLIYSSVQYRF